MKKIYSVLLWMVLSAVCLPMASAHTMTITIDNPDAASYLDPHSYYPGSWDENNSVVFEFGEGENEQVSVPIVANDGYELTGAYLNGEPVASYVTSSFVIPSEGLEEDAVFYVTTQAKEPKVLKIVGDPSVIVISDQNYQDHGADENVDGAWTLTDLSEWGTTYIRTIDDNYMITSVYSDNGYVYVEKPTETAQIYHETLSSGLNTITVETKKLTDLYSGNVTVNVNGSRYFVSFRFKDQYNGVDLKTGSNKVLFNPETDLPFYISNAYNSESNPQSLYQVSLNGEVLVPNEERVYVISSVNNGDVIDIEVDAPAKDVPVSVTFEDETAKKALQAIYSDGTPVDPETYGSFIGKLGKTLQFRFDAENYDVTLNENGTDKQILYSSYSTTLSDESGYNYIVKANAIDAYKVTIICDDYEHLLVSPDYYLETVYDLTGVETELSILPGNKYTYIKAEEGWRVASIIDVDTNQSLSSPLYVKDGQTIYVELERFERDKHFTLYTEPCDWYYLYFALNPNDYELGLQFIPELGYSTIAYNDGDRPFGVTSYDPNYNAGEVFLNGELLEGYYGNYPALAEVQDGDVIKIMSAGAPLHDVTYNVSDEVSVKVVHDLTMNVDHSAAHQVHAGTEIHIIPVAREGAGIKVLAGETELTPDADGKYVHTVTEPVEITVVPAVPTSIIDIEAAAVEANDVYNLQGIKVLNAANASEIKSLPAGVYISGGKKIIVK